MVSRVPPAGRSARSRGPVRRWFAIRLRDRPTPPACRRPRRRRRRCPHPRPERFDPPRPPGRPRDVRVASRARACRNRVRLAVVDAVANRMRRVEPPPRVSCPRSRPRSPSPSETPVTNACDHLRRSRRTWKDRYRRVWTTCKHVNRTCSAGVGCSVSSRWRRREGGDRRVIAQLRTVEVPGRPRRSRNMPSHKVFRRGRPTAPDDTAIAPGPTPATMRRRDRS